MHGAKVVPLLFSLACGIILQRLLLPRLLQDTRTCPCPCLCPAPPSQVREIMSSPLLPRLLQDAYGNYVVQSVLSVHLAAPVPSSAPPAAAAAVAGAAQPVKECAGAAEAGGDGAAGAGTAEGLGAGGGVVMMTTASLLQYAVDAIRPYTVLLQATPHGKRILQRIGGKL